MKTIIYGTMRMLTAGLTADQWAERLHELNAHGIRHLHSSTEYDSFPLLREALQIHAKRYPDESIEHFVKLAEPSFGETVFDSRRFRSKIEAYRRFLEVEQIHGVQWMWRGDLQDEAQRLHGLQTQADEIRLAFEETMQNDHARHIYCFPYTRTFAETVLDLGIVHGLTVYQNPAEQEYSDILDESATRSHITIRPLQAGKSLGRHGLDELLDRTLEFQSVDATIVTATQPDHLQRLYDYVANRA